MTARYVAPDDRAVRWVSALAGASVARVVRLTGGITSAVDLLVVRGAGGVERRLVLRRWVEPQDEPRELVARETAALHAVAAADTVPAPRLVAADPVGDIAGVPSVLMTEVPGRVQLAPRDRQQWIRQLAAAHAAIHRLPRTIPFRTEGFFDATRDRPWITDPGLRRAALAAAASSGPTDDVFAHGDVQPFNVLWDDRTVSGIVDWPNAGVGPRGVDVGHCCLNLAVLYSPDAAIEYLRCYESASGRQPAAAEVLRGLLVWGRDWPQFIPIQAAGRIAVDAAGMPGRVVETIRRVLAAG